MIMEKLHFVSVLLVLFLTIHSTGATCNFPTDFYVATWYSSNGGTLNMTISTMSSFTVHTFGSFVFTCNIHDGGSKYVSKSESFTRYNLPFEAFLCMDITRQSANKYTYYQPTAELSDAGNIRMKIFLQGKTISSASEICDVTDYSTLTNHILLKENTISTEKIDCPTAMQGKFNYTFDAGSGNTCTGSSSLDVCTDTTLYTYDYSLCSTVQAYSAGGQLNCVYYTTSGSFTYLHVYNLDATTDESTTYRFTCYVISGSGSTVYATQYPQDCYYGQNSTYVNSTGAALVYTLTEECATDDTTTTVASSSLGIVIGVIIALLAIFLLIAFIVWFCWKKKRDEERKRREEAERLANEGLPDESMYDIDRLMYTPDQLLTPSHVHPKVTGKIIDKQMEGLGDDEYMDDFGWQDLIEPTDYMSARKRKEENDAFEVGDAKNVSTMKRIKSMIKKKKKKGKKKKKKSKSKSKKYNTDAEYETESEHELDDKGAERVGHPDELAMFLNGGIPGSEIDPAKIPMKRRLRREVTDVDTVSGIIDMDLMAGGLDTARSWEDDDKKVPRLHLPNLREDKESTEIKPKKKKKKKKAKPPSFKTFRRRKVDAWLDGNPDPLPLFYEDPNEKKLPALQRVNRKRKPKLWSDILNKFGSDFPELDFKAKRKNMSENRWRKLLEELYTDKKYFDYVSKSTRGKKGENDIKKEAGAGLDYLFDRANFWEEQKPIPSRPVSFVASLPSKPKRKKSPKRRQPPATPMTQVRLDSMHPSMTDLNMIQRESTM